MGTFLLVKPDGLRFIHRIRREVEKKAGIGIKKEIRFDNWQHLAPLLYQRRLNRGDTKFRADFKLHVWLQTFFFGEEGRVLLLDSVADSLQEEIKTIYNLRNQIRKSLYRFGDERVKVIVNVKFFEDIGDIASGYEGYLSVSNGKTPHILYPEEGKWDVHRFTYVHAPEDIEEFQFQIRILQSELNINLEVEA